MNVLDAVINSPDSTEYREFLKHWIDDIGFRNLESFNYNNVKDVAIGIYLLCNDNKIDLRSSMPDIVEFINTHYQFGSLIQKLLTDIIDRKPDLLEIISEISDKSYSNSYMSTGDLIKHLETLYNTEKISEEQNRETLIFGDNILHGEMTSRELCDTVRMMTAEYVGEYVTDLNLGEIDFMIPDSSIMYLRDTAGVEIAVVYTETGNKHVIRYTTEDGSALFLLFEPKYIKNETIYGLSLDSAVDEERGLLILEKDKDESVYKLLFGRSEF